jgi:amino acid transporter
VLAAARRRVHQAVAANQAVTAHALLLQTGKQDQRGVPLESPTIVEGGVAPTAPAETGGKGLAGGSLGLFASVVIGVASTAPAYSLAATVGLVAAGVGLHSPFIFIVGFIPMILVASGFSYMNKADPDCGETFIWTSRAFGPQLGWVIGFAAVASSVIVMANLVQIAALYMWQFLGLTSLANSTFWTTVGGVGWLLVVAVFVAIGIKVSAKAQYVLMAMQMVPMVIFTVWAIVKGYVNHPAGFAGIHFSHFFTTHITGSQLASGVVLAVFLYWGWDTVLAVNEESKDSSRMPGLSAVLNTLILVFMYVIITEAMQMYHGAKFLSDNPGDVFTPLAHDVMGHGWDKLVLLSVFTSGAASALTTLLPLTRQTLSMAAHKSLPSIFGKIHPKYLTPFWGTVILTVLSILWYVLLTWINVNALYDAITALGIMVCIAYGGTGLACTVYYRKEIFKSGKNFFLIGLAPFVGALMFAAILAKVIYDDYRYSSGNSYTSFHGVGGVFLMGVGVVVLGVILMVLMWIFKPEFFRRKPETWPGEGQPIPYADERVE